jgi:hypothetical protein
LAINVGDVLFTRQGRPALVTARDPQTASVSLEQDLAKVQSHTTLGIKNGLTPEQRDTFESVRLGTMSQDKAEEIQRLRDQIKDLKEKGGDKKVIRYLMNELQHLVVREGIVPRDYMVQERTLVKG